MAFLASATWRLLHQSFRLQDGGGELEARRLLLVFYRAQVQEVGLPPSLHDQQTAYTGSRYLVVQPTSFNQQPLTYNLFPTISNQ